MKKFLLLALIPLGLGIHASAIEQTDGLYQLSSPAELAEFATLVNEGNNAANAVLTADIDLSGMEFPMIGTDANMYSGTFDGQYHTVTIQLTPTNDCAGLFYKVMEGTIQNLRVAGTIETSRHLMGGIAGIVYGTTIQNCVSSVEILTSFAGDAADGGICSCADNTANRQTQIFNCVFDGKIKGENAYNSGGLVGWCYNSTLVTNCLQIGEMDIVPGFESNTIARNAVICTNVYYKQQWGWTPVSGVMQTSDDQLASGEICYLMNGNQSIIQWTQTLGEDACPYPFPTHQTVYIIGQVDCIGRIQEGLEYSFSNTGEINLPPHNFVNGTCTVCGTADPNTKVELKDGYYQLGTPEHLAWFISKVNGGEPNINAQLTADIDLTGLNMPMIGTDAAMYSGTFDGQYHTVTIQLTPTSDCAGLFYKVSEGTIQNLHVAGVIETSHHLAGGIAGIIYGTTIRNCISSVEILSYYSGDAADGGICSCADNTANRQTEIVDCLFDGRIVSSGAFNSGGLVGWCYNPTLVTNCLQIGELDLVHSQGNTIARNAAVCTNVYYKTPFDYIPAGATQITDQQLGNGEVCYFLNGDQSNIQWTQALGVDEYPMPFPTGPRVCKCGSVIMNVGSAADVAAFVAAVTNAEREYADNVIARKELVAQFAQFVESLSRCTSVDELLTLYGSDANVRPQVEQSEQSYAGYMAKVDEAKTYLAENTDLQGEWFDLLHVYLEEYDEPSDTYPNGSCQYIMDALLLTDSELQAEIRRIDEMMKRLIILTPVPGTDVTLLLVNPDFREGFNGWQGRSGTGYGVTSMSTVPAAECWNNTMDIYQTVTGLKNGIYELRVNATFRPYPITDYFNTNYAAMIYANDLTNYVQANIEGMIPEAEAVDGWNCYLTGTATDAVIEDETGALLGYCPWAWEGASVAFQAGRYQNAILANVTDGSLTVGIRQPGTGNQPEWLGFGNVQLIYRGTMEEANEGLDFVLASQTARATTMLENYEFSYGGDYKVYPNFAQTLKDELASTVAAVANTTDPAEKYVLIQRFSELFQQVYESKRDYVKVMDFCVALNDLSYKVMSFLDKDEQEEILQLMEYIDTGYFEGIFGHEECTKDYLSTLSFINFNPEETSQIGSAKELALFAVYSNIINPAQNAVLTADIDLTGSEFPIIGSQTQPYTGTFDGGYHTVTLNQTASQSFYGLFGALEGATVRNLHTAGDINTNFILTGGIAGQAMNSTIENCISSVNIISSFVGDSGQAGICGYPGKLTTIKDCVFNGSITGESTINCGGLAGWLDGTTFFIDCLQIGTIEVANNAGDTWNISRHFEDARCTNVYYLNPTPHINDGSIQITKEQLENGEVTFLLNGSQELIRWTQTLGEDLMPFPFPNHKQVYADGEVQCDGKIFGDVRFTNDVKPLPAHQYESGTCIVCGKTDPDFKIELVDGFYQIENVAQLMWFTNKVNEGETAINAQIMADIDLTDVEFPMIGTEQHRYGGTFDGGCHTIKYAITAHGPVAGLFYIVAGGTIRNLHVSGTIETAFNIAGGISGEIFGGTIQNCVSSVEIVSSFGGDAAYAGIVSVADDFQGQHSRIINCLFDGTIAESGAFACGGLVGWCSNLTYLTNCLQAGDIRCGQTMGAVIARNLQNALCTNVYYLRPQGELSSNLVQVTEEQLGSGEACYLLNGDQSEINWYQNLSEDACPLPFSTHSVVIKNEDGTYGNATGIEAVQDTEPGFRSGVYDLSGRRILGDKLTKGIYIINGKKFFVK